MEVLRRVGWRSLLLGTVSRIRSADGLAFARAVAFQAVMAAVPAVIFLVALTVWTASPTLRSGMEESVKLLGPDGAPSPLIQAIRQGEKNAGGNVVAVFLSGITALVSGAGVTAHLQAGFDRIYGVEDDRPWLERYRLATGLAVATGALVGASILTLVVGDVVIGVFGDIWRWLRWPLGLAAVSGAVTLLFKKAPNRNQPPLKWLAAGGVMAVILWVIAAVGLGIYLEFSSTFGRLYGRLAGFIGILLWAQLSSLAVFVGMAFTAQLETELTEVG